MWCILDYIKLNMCFVLDTTSMCIDVSMYKYTSEYQWKLGDCVASQSWVGPAIYTDKCCISRGEYLLTCATSREIFDWSSTSLTMLGHQFCDDQTGYAATISINVSCKPLCFWYRKKYIDYFIAILISTLILMTFEHYLYTALLSSLTPQVHAFEIDHEVYEGMYWISYYLHLLMANTIATEVSLMLQI